MSDPSTVRAIRKFKGGQAHRPKTRQMQSLLVGPRPPYETFDTACGRTLGEVEVVMLWRVDTTGRCMRCYPHGAS